MIRNKIIGLSGVAGVGKDTFYSLLSERVPCVRFALADVLKEEVNLWCKKHYFIDPSSCSREDKEIIRPLLVTHGVIKRKQTEGRYWIEKLEQKLHHSNSRGFVIITDIRYDEYENDEVSWLKKEMNGLLVHISQFKKTDDSLTNEFKAPANAEEERNNPRLIEKSDYKLEWETVTESHIHELSTHIDNFMIWLQKKI